MFSGGKTNRFLRNRKPIHLLVQSPIQGKTGAITSTPFNLKHINQMNNVRKELENLYSWKEFARTGSTPNIEVMDIIDIQIDEYKAKYNIR